VYDELRRLARVKMTYESPDHTLQATALVHEAFLRLVCADKAQHWDSRRHFFSAAAESMRRILVENARRKKRLKRGGDKHRALLEEVEATATTSKLDVLALNEALGKLAVESPEKAEVVQLRFFCGLSYEEVAEILGVSTITVKRHWRYARVWLLRQMEGNQDIPIE
jgi:RNA polymerase sigma factor (TIGR02999 family)